MHLLFSLKRHLQACFHSIRWNRQQIYHITCTSFPLFEALFLIIFPAADAHYGVDLLAPKGATVHATAQGTVIFSSWTQDGGYVIALQHARGLVSFYKHNTTLLKTVGDKVLAGDPLAIIGNTGALSTGPHLHFEIWHNSQPVDPESFITF